MWNVPNKQTNPKHTRCTITTKIINYSVLAPPAYEESMLGRTETSQGALETDYLPRYAVYQFPSGQEPLVVN